MRSRKNIYIRLIALSITFALSSLAWGQTVKNYYKNDYSSYSIQYKTKTKWHDLRTIKDDTDVKDKFDENETFTVTVDGSYQNIQPSHVLIDTIYVHKGSKYLLSLPDRSENSYSIRSYQRWYNLKTGKTFEVGSDGVTVDTNELVKDLLYPKDYKTQDIEKPARFTNGYVGDPLALTSAMASIPALDMYFYYPKEEQYNKFPKENEKTLVNPDNNEYLIACDVSGYTDYKDGFEIDSEMHFGGSDWKTYTEPTLSHRIIYCIRAIENEKDWRYKFFTDNKNEDKYLEEYEINMPAIRIPDKTQEMVCIATAANAYAVPTNTNDTETLTVNLIDGDGAGSNKSDIQLCDADGNTLTSSTLSGTNRIIHFKYPGNPDTNGTLSVTDGSTATILVTKKVGGKTFRIARFKLTFNKSSVLLTQSQINLIDNPTSTSGAKADASLTEYTYRTPKYLEEHYTCVTDLDFDFPSEIAGKYGQPQVYPYPLGWSESSYGFYDGSAQKREGSGDNVNFMGQGGGRELPQWGYYAILNDYVENGNTTWGLNSSVPTAPTLSKENRKGKDSSYHLYVDASDQPGMIARLTFDHPLCPGSQLFVSAWVKVAQPYNTGMFAKSDNAAMLFTIMGVTEGETGKERDRSYTPIYRYQTGQIPGTYTAKTHPNIPGFGGEDDCNQWLHVHFSFTNKSALQTAYDSYVLQIDNNSASTKGGDMYIDDIRVYIASPKVEVKQKSPTCHANNVDALLQMTLDWDRLLSRLGVEELTTEPTGDIAKAHVSFCFVDSAKFISAYNKISNPINNEEACKTAFKESIIKLAYPTQKGSTLQTSSYEFGKLLFNPYYSDNNEYNDKETNIQDITDAKDAGHFYRLGDGLGKALVADIHCALEPFRTYFLVLEENHGEVHDGDDLVPDIERFKYYYNAPLAANSCVAKTSFQLEAQNSIKVNGMLSEKSDHTFCNGQIVNFGVQLKAATDDSGEVKPITENVYYDWYLNSLEEFQKEPGSVGTTTTTGSNSVHQALINFRESCPDATTPDEWTTASQSDKDLLATLVKENKLILRQATLNTHATDNGDNKFKLVVVPIPLELGETDKKTIICTDPMEIQLDINGNAPVAHVGFEDVVYPDERTDNPDNTYFPTIRASKGIQEACKSESALLEIPLRNIKLNSAGTSTTSSTTAPSFTINTTYPYLYLIDSNDPVVANKIAEINKTGTFESHTWPVATIKTINAVPNSTGDISKTADQYIRVYFETPTTATLEGMSAPKFREGYWYTLMAYFAENGTSSPSTTATCEGNLTFNLKVVPEYQKWSGPADGSGNWNNDDNWLRSTADELHKGINYDDDYTPGETYYGFVPMSFTKVTIPEGKQVQLYEATPNTAPIGSSDHPILDLASTDKPATITNPATTHIEYDLMVKEATANGNKVAYNCKTYYTNTVDQIHFEPSTAMPHTELLTYNKAWIDYKLAGRRWYTLASPLQSVVAGDWYTSKTGSQATEYFKDIKFNMTNYNRFQPSVYQRGWKQQANMITIGSDGSSNGKTVAVAGNWSGVYNNVAVPYTPGLGFSVKVLNLSTTTTPATDPAVALFRFPKGDTEYSYYDSENNTSGNQVDVRTTDDEQKNAGKLKSDLLKSESEVITVTLMESTTGTDADYHLIGNPFMAYLDASKFFDTNANLQKKFWLVTGDNQTAAVGGTDDSDWITNIGTTRIAPLQSFFVKKAKPSTYADNNTVTFSANMQALAPTANTGTTASSATLKSSSPLPLLTLVATTADGRQSRAVIAYDRTVSEEYKANEDAELFLDSNLGDLPAIYTVTGTMAASINRTSNLWNIPVGTYSNRSGNNGNNPETVTLTFEGLDRFTGTTLYDVEKKTETALHHNSSITIAANTYGRYFLRAGTPTGNEKVETETIRIYTIVRGQLIVTATENLQTVAIYDFAGRLLRYSDTPSGCLFTTHLDKGNYIVRATSEHQQQTSKIQIR